MAGLYSDKSGRGQGFQLASSPLSISRRTASEREGFGSGWRSIQAAIFASSSSDQRTVLTGSLPVAGRPGRLFSFSAIDPPLRLR